MVPPRRSTGAAAKVPGSLGLGGQGGGGLTRGRGARVDREQLPGAGADPDDGRTVLQHVEPAARGDARRHPGVELSDRHVGAGELGLGVGADPDPRVVQRRLVHGRALAGDRGPAQAGDDEDHGQGARRAPARAARARTPRRCPTCHGDPPYARARPGAGRVTCRSSPRPEAPA